MQFGLNKLCTYFSKNRLTINYEKSLAILLHTKRPTPWPPIPILFLDQNPLKFTKSFKYLGVHITSNLSWNLHLEILRGKLSRAIFVLKRIAPFILSKDIKTIYYTVFHSHLNYANLNWGHCSDSALKNITSLQNRAFRIISYWHPTFLMSPFPPNPQTIHFKMLSILYFKFKNNLLPLDLQNRLSILNNPPSHSHNTRGKDLPPAPSLRTEYGRTRLYYQIYSRIGKILEINEGCTTLLQLKNKLKEI